MKKKDGADKNSTGELSFNGSWFAYFYVKQIFSEVIHFLIVLLEKLNTTFFIIGEPTDLNK